MGEMKMSKLEKREIKLLLKYEDKGLGEYGC